MNTTPKIFYYGFDGKVVGPVTGIELREAAFAGRVRPTTPVSTGPSSWWVTALYVRGLFDAQGQPLPHPPETLQFLELTRQVGTSRPHSQSAIQPVRSPPDVASQYRAAATDVEITSRNIQTTPEWYVQVGERQVGPLAENQIQQMAHDGRIRQTDLIWNTQIQRWVEAEQVSTLEFIERVPPSQTIPSRPWISSPNSLVQNQTRLRSRPPSTRFAWTTWPIAFVGMFAAYSLLKYAAYVQDLPLLVFSSLSLNLTICLHAAYLTWLILDIEILRTTLLRASGHATARFHFSPVWGIPIAGLCCPGILILPLSMLHLLRDRKEVIKQINECDPNRSVRWATIREVMSNQVVIVGIVLTWVPTCVMVAFNLLTLLI